MGKEETHAAPTVAIVGIHAQLRDPPAADGGVHAAAVAELAVAAHGYGQHRASAGRETGERGEAEGTPRVLPGLSHNARQAATGRVTGRCWQGATRQMGRDQLDPGYGCPPAALRSIEGQLGGGTAPARASCVGLSGQGISPPRPVPGGLGSRTRPSGEASASRAPPLPQPSTVAPRDSRAGQGGTTCGDPLPRPGPAVTVSPRWDPPVRPEGVDRLHVQRGVPGGRGGWLGAAWVRTPPPPRRDSQGAETLAPNLPRSCPVLPPTPVLPYPYPTSPWPSPAPSPHNPLCPPIHPPLPPPTFWRRPSSAGSTA